jgi:hypothetical protein
MEEKYKDKSVVVELYHEQGMSQAEVADELGCPVQTLSYWFDKHDIEARGPGWYHCRKPAHHTFTETGGYEKWRTSVNGDRKTVMVHHLVLISEGRDPNKVFSEEFDTHHKNKMPSDNRPENLELVRKEEHGRMHANERWEK